MENAASANIKAESNRWFISYTPFSKAQFFGWMDENERFHWKFCDKLSDNFVMNELYESKKDFCSHYDVTFVSKKYVMLRGWL